jgi:hypothetical protein
MKPKIFLLIGMILVLTGCYIFISSKSKPLGEILMTIGLLLELVFLILNLKQNQK